MVFKMKGNSKVNNVRIIGAIQSFAFQRAKYLVSEMHRSMPLRFPSPEIEGLLEMDWYLRLTEWRQLWGPEFWRLRRSVAVFVDEKFIGSDIELLKIASLGNVFVENIPSRNSTLMKKKFEDDYLAHLRSTKRTYCYFDITVDDNFVGTLIFELYSEIVPKTCENFITLCLGTKGRFLSYKGSRIHRIVKNGWLQGGHIQYITGGGGFSIYCSPLEDECYAVSHDRRGVLSMANDGKHTNGSQFFITLNPCTWLDTYYVAFGRLIQGVKILNLLEDIETIRECPLKKIEIKNCGKLDLQEFNDSDVQRKKDQAPKKKKNIETIADQIVRLIMEAVTSCLANKEHLPDVTHAGDAPSVINIDFYFQGFYSLPEEVLEDSAKYIRSMRREMLRNLKSSATEVAEVITYDLLEAVFTKLVDLDDVREVTGHPMYQKLLNGIDMKLEMVEKPYIKKFIDQMVTTAELMVQLISRKLNWSRRTSLKTRVFQEQMTEWVQSFVLQETFAGDNFYIGDRSTIIVSEEKGPYNLDDTRPAVKRKILQKRLEECGTEKKEEKKKLGKKHSPVDICCGRKELDDCEETKISDFFSRCGDEIKTTRGTRETRISLLELIEICRYHLRIFRHQELRHRSKSRICLEKRINRWMKGVAYTPETEWIRQGVFSKGEACLKHTEYIMYGAMTVGLLEMYFLMEKYLKQPKKKYRTRIIYPDDGLPSPLEEPTERIPDESSYSRLSVDSKGKISDSTRVTPGSDDPALSQVGVVKAKEHKPCKCGDVCCDCTSEPRSEASIFRGSAPPTPPPSLNSSRADTQPVTPTGTQSVEGIGPVKEEFSEESCPSDAREIDVEELLSQVTGDPADKIQVKSFKWLQHYILEKGCAFKSKFVSQVHGWLENESFNYQGFLSKHSLASRASLLSFSFSLASLIREENNLKSELKDFIYDLWELYFKEMFKEAELEYSTSSAEVPEKAEGEAYGEVEDSREKKEDSKPKVVEEYFDFDKFCRNNEALPKEPEETNSETLESPGEAIVPDVEREPFTTEPHSEVPAEELRASEVDVELDGEDMKVNEAIPEAELSTAERVFTKQVERKAPTVIRELIVSSEELRQTSPYAPPFWIKFLTEITKRAMGLMAKLSRLPRRLYFNSDSQISFDDKMKAWIEFNDFYSPTTEGRDIRNYIAQHHVSLENLQTTARSFLRKKMLSELIEKSSRMNSAEAMGNEILMDLLMDAVEKTEMQGPSVPNEVLQDLIGLAIANAYGEAETDDFEMVAGEEEEKPPME